MPQKAERVWDPSFWEGFRPDPVLTVSQWADRHRVLSSRSSDEPGRWRTDRAPYLREVMDCLSVTSPVERVVLMWGAQLGKTESGNNWIGYIVDQVPAPCLVVQPTVELAKKMSRQRLEPMMADSERLRSRVRSRVSRDASNTVLMKEFPDGILVITGANSAAGLRQMPARYVFLDEVDAYPGDVEGEGDPVRLAMRAQRNFFRSKTLETSTPTLQGRSRIERDAQVGDRRYYLVPCPECGHSQRLRWSGVRWRDEDLVTLEKGVKQLRADAEPWYECEACAAEIDEGSKTGMLEAGQWVPEDPSVSERTRSYFLSALYSPLGWFSWSDAVDQFLEATTPSNKPDLLRVFVNHTLGETYYERGQAPPWEVLYRRRESYPIGRVPAGALVLTAGADVQEDRIELEVVGWGEGLESWSVAYHVIRGDTSLESTWRDFRVLLDSRYLQEGGATMRLRMTAIDASFRTQTVYNFVRAQRGENIIAVQGRESLQVLLGQPRAVDVTTRKGGRRIARGTKAWPVGVSVAKRELYGWLGMEEPTNPEEEGYPQGWCHFPEYGEEYFRQLTAEELVPRIVRGFRRYVWEKTRERNEALDCRVYARAAAVLVGIDRWNPEHWEELRDSVKSGSVGATQARPARRRRRREGERWLD